MSGDIELFNFNEERPLQTKIKKLETIRASSSKSRNLQKQLRKEFNFFTNYNNEVSTKANLKESQKRLSSATTSDRYNSELGLVESNILVNQITFSHKYRKDYHVKSPFHSAEPQLINKKILHRFKDDDLVYWNFSDFFDNSVRLIPDINKIMGPEDSKKNVQIMYTLPEFINNLQIDQIAKQQSEGIFLNLNLCDITFTYHHTMKLEEVLAQQLIETYRKYMQLKGDIINCLKDLNTTRAIKDKIKSELEMLNKKQNEIYSDLTLSKYIQDLSKLKEYYLDSLSAFREMATILILLWHDILKVRKKSGKHFTKWNLRIYENKIKAVDFDKQWKEMYSTELADLIENRDFTYIKRNIPQPDDNELKDQVIEILSILVPDDQEISLELVEEAIDVDAKTENDYYYSFKIYIDNKFVCETKAVHIGETYCLNLEETFCIQIRGNKKLSIELYENGSLVSNEEITLDTTEHNLSFAKEHFVNFKFENNVRPTEHTIGTGNSFQEIARTCGIHLKSKKYFPKYFFTNCVLRLSLFWSTPELERASKLKTYMEVTRELRRDNLNSEIAEELIGCICDGEHAENSLEKYKKCAILSRKQALNFQDTSGFEFDNFARIRFKLLQLREQMYFPASCHQIVPLAHVQLSSEHIHVLESYIQDGVDLDNFIEMDPIDIQRYTAEKYINNLQKNFQQKFNAYSSSSGYKDMVNDFQFFSLRAIMDKKNHQVARSSKRQALLSSNISLDSTHKLRIILLKASNLPKRINYSEMPEEANKTNPAQCFIRVCCSDVSAQTSPADGTCPTWNEKLELDVSPNANAIDLNFYDEVREEIQEKLGDEETSSSSRVYQFRLEHKWLGFVHIPMHTLLCLGSVTGTFKISMPPIILGYKDSKHEAPDKIQNSYINKLSHLQPSNPVPSVTLQMTIHPAPFHYYKSDVYVNNSDDDHVARRLKKVLEEYLKEFPSRHATLQYADSSGTYMCVTQFLQPLIAPDFDCFHRTKNRRGSVGSKTSASSKDRRNTEIDGDSATPRSNDIWTVEKALVSSRQDKSYKPENNLEALMCYCARYVSLIPLRETATEPSITLLGIEFLRILNGSVLDHNILLASYFLYLGVKCWILAGYSSDRAFTTYVLVKYDLRSEQWALTTDKTNERSKSMISARNDIQVNFIYDAASGLRYQIKDACCPLKTVHYVYNNEQIWLNIQASGNCEEVLFDFTRSSDWQPVFNAKISPNVAGVVSDLDLYSSPANVENIKNKLENKIKWLIQKWRHQRKTIWNRYCSNVLREILPHLEGWSFGNRCQKPPIGQRMKQLMASYQLYGFPLNFPYNNIKTILNSIKKTQVFLTEDPTAEFGLAVEIYSYPGTVLSVWVYIARITRM